MTTYHDLPDRDKTSLLKFPVYISLLAANYHNNGMDKKEKKTAIEFAHIKSFEHDPVLADFYTDAEKNFEKNLTLLDSQLPKQKKEREIVIKGELNKIEKILLNLGTDYAKAMHQSMQSYKEHVANAHQSLLEYLIFPIPIKGLTY